MSLKEWLNLMLGRHQPTDPARISIDQTERELVQRLAKVRNQSPAQVRAEARRRALQIEADSLRRR